MKKRVLLLLLVMSMLLLTACGEQKRTGKVVNVYNWGEYIDKDLLTKFEEETGIHVVYSTFTTNEDLYVKLKNGGSNYDVIVPSEYMAERMIKEGMLRKINWDNVPNIQYIDKEYLNMPQDPNQEYTAPCFWGTLGIVYNTKLVHEKIDSWYTLWDPKYARDIIMMDSSRDSIGIALKMLGYSMNSRNPEELKKAEDLLVKQYPLVYAYLVDQTKDIMKNGEAKFAVMYSGDALDAIFANEDLAYVIPKEGSNLWFDTWCIPTNAQNPENAEKFINFMLNPENAAQNAEWVGYSLPSTAARELLSEDYRDSKVAYPDKSVLKRLEVFRDPSDFVKVYDEIWQRVKNQ